MQQQWMDELVTWAQAQPEILALYLFGSAAEGHANALSVVDIGVLAQIDLARPQ